jgi:hypothetical protein
MKLTAEKVREIVNRVVGELDHLGIDPDDETRGGRVIEPWAVDVQPDPEDSTRFEITIEVPAAWLAEPLRSPLQRVTDCTDMDDVECPDDAIDCDECKYGPSAMFLAGKGEQPR